MTITAATAGFLLGASLIMAIGAQNAFVLRQGIRSEYPRTVAGLCVVIDWSLIAVGAVGFGRLVERFPQAGSVAAWGGAAYLIVYGALSFRAAMKPGRLAVDENVRAASGRALPAIVGATLAVSLLNPHVYLDTVVLLGSVASQYPSAQRLAFIGGAGIASFSWFFGLALGGRLLAPLFANPRAWTALDVVIGIVMWTIAGSLVAGQLL